jgi:hypothetical protein
MQEMVKEFEKAQKPFELLKTKTEDIMKKEGPVQVKMEQIKILNNAFNTFLETTKRKDVKKEIEKLGNQVRMNYANSFMNSADELYNKYTHAVFKGYSSHLLNAGVDVTSLTRTVSDTVKEMKKFAKELRELANNPEAYNNYLNNNLPSLLNQYEKCISETQEAFSKASEVKETTKAVGSALLGLEVSVLLAPVGAGLGFAGRTVYLGMVGMGDVIVTETMRGHSIKDIPPSELALGFTVGAISPVAAEKFAHLIGSKMPKLAGMLETEASSRIFTKFTNILKPGIAYAAENIKAIEKIIEYLVESGKTAYHMEAGITGEKHE